MRLLQRRKQNKQQAIECPRCASTQVRITYVDLVSRTSSLHCGGCHHAFTQDQVLA